MVFGSFDEFLHFKMVKFHLQKIVRFSFPHKWFHMNETGVSVIIALVAVNIMSVTAWSLKMTSKVPGECIRSNRSSGKSGNTSAPAQFHPSALAELQLGYTLLFWKGQQIYIYIYIIYLYILKYIHTIHIFMATYKIDIFKNIWSHKTSQTFKHTSTCLSTYNLIGPAPFSIGTVAGKNSINLASPTASQRHCSTSTWGNEHGGGVGGHNSTWCAFFVGEKSRQRALFK